MTIYENIKKLESVGQLSANSLVNADCLEAMTYVADKSIDCIIADLPYGQFGTTACKWDTIIPFEPLWEQYKRIIKNNGAIVLFGSQPFTSALVMSNLKWFKYEWVWNKKLAGNGVLAKIQPLKIHENIIVFSNGKVRYNPQMTKGRLRKKMFNGVGKTEILQTLSECKETFNDEYYPVSIQDFSIAGSRINRLHPTQKTVALLEYLIKTYTNENNLVLDNCMGSGSTGVACVNTNRKFIGIELDEKYYDISCKRIKDAINAKKQQLF